MLKIKAGDYIRTKDGVIAKITDIIEDISIDCDRDVFDLNYLAMMEIPYCVKDEYIIKSSPNIIDLIEVGDFVNGLKVDKIDENGIYNSNSYDGWLVNIASYNEDIKSIVTKEQFESMEYRIEE